MKEGRAGNWIFWSCRQGGVGQEEIRQRCGWDLNQEISREVRHPNHQYYLTLGNILFRQVCQSSNSNLKNLKFTKLPGYIKANFRIFIAKTLSQVWFLEMRTGLSNIFYDHQAKLSFVKMSQVDKASQAKTKKWRDQLIINLIWTAAKLTRWRVLDWI